MKWLVNQLKENNSTFNTELLRDSQCGAVHGGVLGPLDNNGPVVDVALLRLDVNVEQQCARSLKFPDMQSPSLTLGEVATEILNVEDFPRHIFTVYGRGARSIDTMEAVVNPLLSEIYIRPVNPSGVSNLVFNCIHAVTKMNWQTGDSGTWCWTKVGLLVGMGMAYANIEGKRYCCMMTMSLVVAAIEQLILEAGREI